MKRFALIALALMAASQAFAQKAAPFGSIDYVEGSAVVVRSGKSLGEANIGDDVLPDDMIKTAADGLVVIALDRSTGMRGTLTIKAKSVAYIRLSPDAGGAKSTIEMVAGQLSSKLAKLSGNPTLQVQTDSVVMGVRGTQFSIAGSVNGSVLVVCTEGAVACTDGGEPVSVPAGKAVEKKAGERLRLVPVAISSAEQFEKRWIADEIEAFKGNAVRALADYEKRYTDYMARFNEAFAPLQRSEVLSKWIREDAAGVVPVPGDATTMREKKAIAGDILATRKVLFIFERLYYRIVELDQYVMGTTLERAELRSGYTVGDFVRRVRSDAPALEKRVFLFRYAEKLYEQRNAGGAGMPGMSAPGAGSGDDFFGSSDDWDF
ncbi:MAG: FecR domain-containing protein [Spirochaetaceae bacterium]|nr:FecR domain-containing protein [Spirochaetaceae bacterium]